MGSGGVHRVVAFAPVLGGPAGCLSQENGRSVSALEPDGRSPEN
jgi:hypothetical protein